MDVKDMIVLFLLGNILLIFLINFILEIKKEFKENKKEAVKGYVEENNKTVFSDEKITVTINGLKTSDNINSKNTKEIMKELHNINDSVNKIINISKVEGD